MGRAQAIRTGPFAGRTVRDLAEELAAGAVTAAELAERALDAIARLDPALGAFTTVDAAGARAAARRADAERASGRDLGPLHGVPVAVKDLIDVAGLPMTAGSAHLRGNVAERDATCVRRLRAAGAVIVGTTRTHEFAYGPTGDRSDGGLVRNPHDTARMTGGSSGGSAAAVAAGLVPLALGTDTGGSVRIPAALCGVAGFKPRYGAVPTDGVFPLSVSLDHVGVLAATADDCRTAARILVGTAPGAPVSDGTTAAGTAPDGAIPDFPAADRASARVGLVIADSMIRTGPAVEKQVQAVLDTAVGTAGTLSFPAAERMHAVYAAIQGSEAYAVHADRVADAPHLFVPEVLERLRAAAEVPGWRYVRAMEARARAAHTTAVLFERYNVLALPTVPITAPEIGRRETVVGGAPVTVRAALLGLTSLWNVLGVPALSVPAGTVGGLPVGLQLVARAGDEELLFAVAARVAGSAATAG